MALEVMKSIVEAEQKAEELKAQALADAEAIRTEAKAKSAGLLAGVKREAKAREAKLVFFGHTHQPYVEYVEGIWFVNPGSIGGHGHAHGRATCALVEIEGGQVRDCRIEGAEQWN